MQLIYRGETYNYDSASVNTYLPAQSTRESSYEVIYRGSTYRVDPTVTTKTFVKPTEYELIYRGTTYQVSRNEPGEVTAIASTSFSKRKTLTTHSAIKRTAGEYSV